MKKSPASPRFFKHSGFTLVELLVVIAIIAILAAAVLGVGTSVINSAKRAKEASMCSQLQTAVMSYYTEYSVYPVAAPTTDTLVSTSAAADWGAMTVNLCGGVNPSAPTVQYSSSSPYNLNTRQIAYLTFNASDLDTTVTPSVPKTPFKSSTGANQYYQMAIDTDYSNVVGDTGTGTAPPDFSGALVNVTSTAMASGKISAAGKVIAGGVAVWANGDPNSTATTTNPKLWPHTY